MNINKICRKTMFATVTGLAIMVIGAAPLKAAAQQLPILPDSITDNSKTTAKFLDDQIVVKFKGAKEPFKVIKVKKGEVDKKVKEHSKRADVEWAQPDTISTIAMVPNDTHYKYQWHLSHATKGINMQPAWDITTGSSSVIVAVVDTGIAYENYGSFCKAPDLANTQFVAGWDFHNNDAHPNDDSKHGTHVAGTIAQSTNNSLAAAGIAPGVKLMPVKIAGSNGKGSGSNMALGIRYAVDNGADVINLSMELLAADYAVRDALKYAFNSGVVVVVACGNSGVSTGCSYPAAYTDYVISVGATRYDETRPAYASYGWNLEVVAPGGDVTVNQNGDGVVDGIVQQTFAGPTGLCSFGSYLLQGTSMAAPHVSGIAALLLSNGNATNPTQIETAITRTAKDLGTAGRDNVYGWGLANAYKALQWKATPSVSITYPYDNTVNMFGGLITIESTATDSTGVSKVEFYDNGVLLGNGYTLSDETRYYYMWFTDVSHNGNHVLTAKAYNTLGNSKLSNPVNFTLDIPVGIDTTNPAVSISAPADGATVSGTTAITATATDNVGVASVEFFVDGVSKGSDTTSPYEYSWDTTTATNGTHSLTAKAVDTSNNSKISTAVSVTVSNTQEPWLNGYAYRKDVTVSNTDTTLSDFQVQMNIDTAALVSGSKMQADCDDMRFTKVDGTTLLNYWIESGCNTSNTIVWVKVPNLPNGDSTVYMYYGNATASAASSGQDTFRFFDDFNDGSLNTSKWVSARSSYASIVESNGYLRLYAAKSSSKLYAYISSYGKQTYPMKILYSVRSQTNNIHGFAGTGSAQSCTYDTCTRTAMESQRNNITYGNPTFAVNGTSVNTQVSTANAWSRNIMNLKTGTSSLGINGTNYQNGGTFTNTDDYLKFSVQKWFSTYTATYDYDYIAVGNLAAAEPSVSVGAETQAN